MGFIYNFLIFFIVVKIVISKTISDQQQQHSSGDNDDRFENFKETLKKNVSLTYIDDLSKLSISNGSLEERLAEKIFKIDETLKKMKNTKIIPILVENKELGNDLRNAIKTDDSDDLIHNRKYNIPETKNKLIFIQELFGISRSDAIDDFLKQVINQKVKEYNHVEAVREGLTESDTEDI